MEERRKGYDEQFYGSEQVLTYSASSDLINEDRSRRSSEGLSQNHVVKRRQHSASVGAAEGYYGRLVEQEEEDPIAAGTRRRRDKTTGMAGGQDGCALHVVWLL
jgi:hypothetical protein